MPSLPRSAYRRRRPTEKRRRKRNFPKYKAIRKFKDYQFGSLSVVNMPNQLFTFLRLSGETIYGTIWKPESTLPYNPQQSVGAFSNVFGYNLLTPWNAIVSTMNPLAPSTQYWPYGRYPDVSYFAETINADLNTWNNYNWFAYWYNRMRITKVYLKIIIKNTSGAQSDTTVPGTTQTAQSSFSDLTVTVLDAKYIANIMTPVNLDALNATNLRSQKGAKTYVLAARTDKPLVIKRTIDVKNMLGIKDMMDELETACTTNRWPQSGSTLINKNPDALFQCFNYLRIDKNQNDPDTFPSRFTMQIQATAKCHYFQRKLNDAVNITTTDGPPAPPV